MHSIDAVIAYQATVGEWVAYFQAVEEEDASPAEAAIESPVSDDAGPDDDEASLG